VHVSEPALDDPQDADRATSSVDADRIDTQFVGNTFGVRIAYVIARSIVCGFTRAYTRMSIDGRRHVPDHGAYVIAPVHRSYIDTPIAACITRRRVRFMGKASMWKHRWIGAMFSVLGAFPVHRGTADRESFKRATAVLDDGEPLVLFPEGERKDGPAVQPLFDGATFVAARAGVPIVPVGIGGSARVMPRGAKFLYPRKVHVVIGEPITVEASASGRVSRKAVAAASAELREELQRLFDEAQSRVG
jgi:1-acyl-sn-glycerol-3-phosphate acyltransferase